MANTGINVVDLDRESLRNDLKNFLKSQGQFKDYDFEGSAMGTQVGLLAYDANKYAFLVNMLFSEAFLDSAQMKSSVFSHAKDLNYTPRSARSSKARLRVSFSATGENQPYIIPKGSTFSTLIKNTQYIFSTAETVVVSSANSQFTFDVDVYEGSYVKDGYIYEQTLDSPHPRFRITNPNVDTSSITVVVFEDGSVIGETYTLRTSLLDLDNNSKVFFLQATENGYYEVLFGDGVVGKTPKDRSSIVIDYRVTEASKTNGAQVFSINFNPTGNQSEVTGGVRVQTLTGSTGGAEPESLESVRYYAPRWYQAQERAVISQDYATLLKVNFPEIDAVSVYGGEEAIPPLYGRVVVSILLSDLETLPVSKQEEYKKFLIKRMPLALKPLFINPEFTYLLVETLVRFNVNITTNSSSRIASIVSSDIAAFAQEELDDFEVTIRKSQITSLIDDADASIVSNLTDIICYKKLSPDLGTPRSFVLDFGFKLVDNYPNQTYPHPLNDARTVYSSPITYQGIYSRIEDDSNGNLVIVQDSGGLTSKINEVGTVDYASGVVRINDLFIDAYDGPHLKIFVKPKDSDISTTKNNVLTLEPDDISVKVETLSL